MRKRNFDNYLYVSETKLQQYIAQLDDAQPTKLSTEAKIKSPVFEYSAKAESDTGSQKYEKLQTIIEEVRRRGLLGELLDYSPWFEATVSVRPLLVGQKVFYVGSLPTADVLPVHFAFQGSLNHFIGIENHRSELDGLARSTGIENKLHLGGQSIVLPSVTSSNHMFASALSIASAAIESSEIDLSQARDRDQDHFHNFFASKEDFELHRQFKPTEYDLSVLAEYSMWNSHLLSLGKGWFGGYRSGLLEAPKWSAKQSLKNLFRIDDTRKYLHKGTRTKKLAALKKLQNFHAVTRRAKTDAESEILNNILRVSRGRSEGAVTFFGIRLLDGYYKGESYSAEGRVILGTPLYLQTGFVPW